MSVTLERLTWQCIEAIKDHGPHVLNRIQPLDIQPGGILPSEMMLFISVALSQGITHVFEGGRKFGYSTEALCQWTRWRVRSCDLTTKRQRDAYLADNYPDLMLMCGNASNLISRWVHATKDRANNVAILLDGPKGAEGLALAQRLAPHVAMIGVHDVMDVPASLYTGFWTRLPHWAEAWGHLDEPAWRDGGYVSRHEMTVDSSGLLIIPGEEWA